MHALKHKTKYLLRLISLTNRMPTTARTIIMATLPPTEPTIMGNLSLASNSIIQSNINHIKRERVVVHISTPKVQISMQSDQVSDTG